MKESNYKKVNISAIIPAYNEEKVIEQTIENLKKELNRLDLNYEIIAINDGSTDRTKEVLEKIDRINLIDSAYNEGYGAALKTGIKKSQNELILIIDADGTYPAESIPELIKYCSDYDMVVGARIGEKARIPLIRKPAKWVLNELANYLSATKIPDLNSGLRIIKKSLLEKFMPILPSGFSFTSTITLAALTNNYRVKYVPINYSKRLGRSKFRPVKDTLNYFQLIIKTILYFNPLKVFVPFALALFFLAIIFLVLSYLVLPYKLDMTVAILLLSSVQIISMGMLADLIVKNRK